MEHSFNIEIAQKYGVNAAVLYRNFQFWIAKNKANGRNFHDGRTWTYNSVAAFADLFPYLSVWNIRQALKRLIDAGILLNASYNKKSYDRRMWYAFRHEKAALKGLPSHLWNSQMECAKSTNPLRKIHKPIPTPTPFKDTDKNKGVEISTQEKLRLDLMITEQQKFVMEQIAIIFHPNKREAKTFAMIAKHLITQCQAGRLQVSIFKEVVEWARQAKRSNATNKKGLFVAKVKQETGFRAQTNFLSKTRKSYPKS